VPSKFVHAAVLGNLSHYQKVSFEGWCAYNSIEKKSINGQGYATGVFPFFPVLAVPSCFFSTRLLLVGELCLEFGGCFVSISSWKVMVCLVECVVVPVLKFYLFLD
jgi:hypothetical protein